MNQSVTIAPAASRNAYGEQTAGTAVSYRCRLVNKRTMVRNTQGQEVISNITLYLMSNALIQPDAVVTLSTGDVGSTESYAIQPKILSVNRYSDDGGGFHHTTVYL